MKNLKHSVFTSIVLFFFLLSCSKASLELEKTMTIAGKTFDIYVINGDVVDSSEVYTADSDTTLALCIVTLDDVNYIHYCSYNTESALLNWLYDFNTTEADSVTMVIENGWELGEQLYEYAISSGAKDTLDLLGYMPQWYYDYVDSLTGTTGAGQGEEMSGKTQGLGFYYKDCVSGGAWPAIQMPAFPSNWNNAISRIEAIGGLHILYDKAFYHKKMVTIANYHGFFLHCFNGKFYDNRTSSIFVL